MYGNHFYNESTRRYVAVFGTLFNDIQIGRKNSAGVEIKRMTVPINYAPAQKLLARLEQDPNLDAPAITLPRMSFEITGMTYNGDRKLTSLTRSTKGIVTDDAKLSTLHTPSPYDIEFQLNIMTKYNEDGTKILEQILPYFKPDVTVSVKMIDTMDTFVDIPVLLNNVSMEDSYEGDFLTRRAMIWTLNFTMKAYFFGPVSKKKMIKFVDANLKPDTATTTATATQVNVQPGLTAAGAGTERIAQTVPYADINFDDDWKYIVQVLDG
jgi:hypothetical protein|tara:strand:- start:3373 stop:4173 length:801 start_codon:yes stop_codon:yes gene_type:complete